ncbi:hypothetical protein K469DRAFT_770913 [Zopfia rhizophila CBS 207.26]|uniref:Uncharacterized protein n=1 Tax=Zopfia rhizophila CBS 207.26 TaxID=1314779 RepID=A0A6A6E932_9PEZI|nr:hypothetical protein K469DRAFT_770913 [Zopfia rhizophila CBS 207.26]
MTEDEEDNRPTSLPKQIEDNFNNSGENIERRLEEASQDEHNSGEERPLMAGFLRKRAMADEEEQYGLKSPLRSPWRPVRSPLEGLRATERPETRQADDGLSEEGTPLMAEFFRNLKTGEGDGGSPYRDRRRKSGHSRQSSVSPRKEMGTAKVEIVMNEGKAGNRSSGGGGAEGWGDKIEMEMASGILSIDSEISQP